MSLKHDLFYEDDKSKVSKAAIMLWIVFVVMLVWWILLFWNTDKADVPVSMQTIFGSLIVYSGVKKGVNAVKAKEKNNG